MSYLSDCITAGRPYEWGRFDIADTTLQFVVQHYTELAQDPEALAASPPRTPPPLCAISLFAAKLWRTFIVACLRAPGARLRAFQARGNDLAATVKGALIALFVCCVLLMPRPFPSKSSNCRWKRRWKTRLGTALSRCAWHTCTGRPRQAQAPAGRLRIKVVVRESELVSFLSFFFCGGVDKRFFFF